MTTINWDPFVVCKPGEKAPYPRALSTPEGLGDRLRFVAFAELQAANAFRRATERFPEVTTQVKEIWMTLAVEEKKHLSWLLERMKAINVDPASRPVSLALWESFERCSTAEQFSKFMASAEERGRVAGEQFYETLLTIDPITAEIFKKIAEDEVMHIQLATRQSK